jgi:hypothetical protein
MSSPRPANDIGLVDLPVVEGQRQAGQGLPHDAGVELFRRFGLEVRIAAGEREETDDAILHKARDRATHGVGKPSAVRQTHLAQWGEEVIHSRRAESGSPGRPQQQRIHRLPAQRHFRIDGAAEIAVVVVARRELHFPTLGKGNAGLDVKCLNVAAAADGLLLAHPHDVAGVSEC